LHKKEEEKSIISAKNPTMFKSMSEKLCCQVDKSIVLFLCISFSGNSFLSEKLPLNKSATNKYYFL
jgi:hypothetical protein